MMFSIANHGTEIKPLRIQLHRRSSLLRRLYQHLSVSASQVTRRNSISLNQDITFQILCDLLLTSETIIVFSAVHEDPNDFDFSLVLINPVAPILTRLLDVRMRYFCFLDVYQKRETFTSFLPLLILRNSETSTSLHRDIF